MVVLLQVVAVEAVVLMVGLLEVVELVLVVVVLHQGLVHFLLALVWLFLICEFGWLCLIL